MIFWAMLLHIQLSCSLYCVASDNFCHLFTFSLYRSNTNPQQCHCYNERYLVVGLWLIGLVLLTANIVSSRGRTLPLTTANKPALTSGCMIIQPLPGGYWLVDFMCVRNMEHWRCCRWITSKVSMRVLLLAWHSTISYLNNIGQLYSDHLDIHRIFIDFHLYTPLA